MGKKTGISWTDHTFNPWWGCIRVSEGCIHCYAETFAKRMGLDIWGPGQRRFFGDKHWNEPLLWNKKAEQEGMRKKVFCASMADVFEDFKGLEEQRERLWHLIAATPNLIWLILTKRIENVESMLPIGWMWPNFPRNIWLGTTTENQSEFDSRWPVLENIGRSWSISQLFISCEPLLGPIDLQDWLDEDWEHNEDESWYRRGIDWVICGGESGVSCRPMNVDWARSLKDQCKDSDVPFFMKQLGGFPDKKDDPSQWPEDLRVQEWPESEEEK